MTDCRFRLASDGPSVEVTEMVVAGFPGKAVPEATVFVMSGRDADHLPGEVLVRSGEDVSRLDVGLGLMSK